MASSLYVRIPLVLAAVLLAASGNPRSMVNPNWSNGLYLAAALLASVVLHYLWILGVLSWAGVLAPWMRAALALLLPCLLYSVLFGLYVDPATLGPGSDLFSLAIIAPGFVLVRLKALLLESLGWGW